MATRIWMPLSWPARHPSWSTARAVVEAAQAAGMELAPDALRQDADGSEYVLLSELERLVRELPLRKAPA